MQVLLAAPNKIIELADVIGTPAEGHVLRLNADLNFVIQAPDFPGSGDMLNSENLSGLTDYNAARTNLGLGTAAVADVADFDPAGAAAAVAATLTSLSSSLGDIVTHDASEFLSATAATQVIPTSAGNGSIAIQESGTPRLTIAVTAGASTITASGALTITGSSITLAGALTVSNGITAQSGASFDGDVLIAPNTGSKFGAFGASAVVQPASANQAAVVGSISDGDFAALTISAGYDQAEVQALRDKCETLADDVRALIVLSNQLRANLVTLGWIKGSA